MRSRVSANKLSAAVVAFMAIGLVACSDDRGDLPSAQVRGFLEFTRVTALGDEQPTQGVLLELEVKVQRMSGASMDTPPDGTKVAVETTIGFLEGGVQRVDLTTQSGLVVFRLTVPQAGQGTVTASYADGSATVALTVGQDGHYTTS